MFITSPEVFADWFNKKIPDAYRQITTDDVYLMTKCILIGKYGFYIRQDLETIRGILLYEQLRENRPMKQVKEKNPLICKSCGQPLLPNPEGKCGRPKEYCSKCESFRNKERQRHYRHRQQIRPYTKQECQ